MLFLDQYRGRFVTTKFSEDVVRLSDLKVNPGRVIKQVAEVRRPVLLTNRGRGMAVVQSLQDYEEGTEERAFMRAIVQGLLDLEEGREISFTEVKKKLKLK